jgi:hypothetical protein
LCLLLQLAPLQGAEQAEVKTGVRESKADEAAMARARRQAQSPMRWILEAGRIARRPGEGEAPSTREAGGAREGSGPREAGPAPAVALAVVPAVVPAARPAEPDIRVTVEPIVALVPPAAVVEPAAAIAPPPLVPLILPPAPGLTMAAPTVRLPAEVPLPLPVPVPDPVPQLLSIVEPAMSAQMLAELTRTTDVVAELKLRADGSVEDVTLLTRAPRSVQRTLLAALSQWRYAPLAQPTLHRVQLAFER